MNRDYSYFNRKMQIAESVKRWAKAKGIDVKDMVRAWGMEESKIDLSKVDWSKISEDIEFEMTMDRPGSLRL